MACARYSSFRMLGHRRKVLKQLREIGPRQCLLQYERNGVEGSTEQNQHRIERHV